MADHAAITNREALRRLIERYPGIATYAEEYADYLAIGDVEPRPSPQWTKLEETAATEARRLLRHEWARRVWNR